MVRHTISQGMGSVPSPNDSPPLLHEELPREELPPELREYPPDEERELEDEERELEDDDLLDPPKLPPPVRPPVR